MKEIYPNIKLVYWISFVKKLTIQDWLETNESWISNIPRNAGTLKDCFQFIKRYSV